MDALDDLVARLAERAADPAHRLGSRPDQFYDSVSRLDLGQLVSLGRSLAGDLRRLVEDGPSPDLTARAGALEAALTTRADRPLPPPTTTAELAAAEQRLGFALPPVLRRLLLEIANGGFGPGSGILGIDGGWTTDRGKNLETLYAELSDADDEHPHWVWPARLVPIADLGGVFACADATSEAGRVVEWDPEELDERGPDGGWSRSFSEVVPSLADWLEAWLTGPAEPAVDPAAEMQRAMSTIPEVTRAYWASMTPQQRAEYGLPERGWGRALFGDAWGDDPRDQ